MRFNEGRFDERCDEGRSGDEGGDGKKREGRGGKQEDGWVDGWEDRWMDGWMGGWMGGWMDG